MRKFYILLAIVWSLVGCGAGSQSPGKDSDVTELSLNQPASGSIAKVGQVNWYRYRAVETNNILQIKCTGPVRPDEELLVTVYEKSPGGTKKRLYADHAPENSQPAAHVRMNIPIDHPKDLYIAVRDLLDDEVSSGNYSLTMQYVGAPDDNRNFTSAASLAVDDAASKLTDAIGHIGDVDCYTFDIGKDGVYGINVAFEPLSGGTGVELLVKLYDGNGVLVDTLENGQGGRSRILSHLTGPDDHANSGIYYLVVEDSGRDHADSASSYQVWVETVPVSEAFANDSRQEAQSLIFDPANQRFEVDGDLEYNSAAGSLPSNGDQDWYRLSSDDMNSTGELMVLKINFDDGDSANPFIYHLEVQDADGNILLSHDFAGSSALYQNQFRAGVGDHYLLVRPANNQHIVQPAPYQASLEVIAMDDVAEESGGNNTQRTAIELTSGIEQSGLIAFRGDVDWYRIQVATDTPKILDLSLKSKSSAVDYRMTLLRSGTQLKQPYDANGANGSTKLKTSIYIPASSAGSATYYVKVGDYQADDGDTVPYRIIARVADVPTSVNAFKDSRHAGGGEETTRFYGEIYEKGMTENESENFELEIFSRWQPRYPANTTFLDFRGTDNELRSKSITRSTAGGVTTINFPWIAGFVDYQGDRDFFKLDLGPLNPAAPDKHWYYDVQLRLVSYPGSQVEYVWKLYRDSNGNQIVMDNPTSPDGYVACNGKADPLTAKPVDIDTPARGDLFWVGDGWASGDARFYLGVQDFNFIKLPASGKGNPLPDDDWGYRAPYYFKLTLVYHPGVSGPPL